MSKKSIKRTELIEKYLDGELQGLELNNFESQLKVDKKLSQDCFLQKIIRETMADRDVWELRNMLDEIRKEFKKSKNT